LRYFSISTGETERTSPMLSNPYPESVMSSGLCKNPEGAVAPFKVETVKD